MIFQTSCLEPTRLQDLLDGQLPAEEEAACQSHLDSCETCRLLLEKLSEQGASLPNIMGGLDEVERQGPNEAKKGEVPVLQRVLAALRGAAGPDTTQADSVPAAEASFDFLAKTDKPGYLGRLGHYEIIELIGKGGMGIVFKAFDTVLQRVVAIKVLSPVLAACASSHQRFLREARAAAAVCHDHVVTIHAVEEHSGLPYLVMQYIAGVSLHDKLRLCGPLGVKEVLRIGLQAAQGLAAAHAHGLVHRDVKPANILLENGVERVKLTDFGLARAIDDASVSQSGVVTGTPQYMAPEQARGEPVSPRTDLFSLGGVLYALCTGQPPFKGSTSMSVLKRVCDENPRPIREINPDVPGWLAEIIGKLMAKAPADRHQSAPELAELLQQHLAVLQQPTGANIPVPSAHRPSAIGFSPKAGHRKLLVVAVILLVLAALACALLVPGLWSDKPVLATLELAPGGPDIEVLVIQDGKAVGMLNTKKKPALELPAGEYEIRLTGDGKGLQLSAERVTLQPGGNHTLWPVGLIRKIYTLGAPSGYWLNRVAFSADSRHALAAGGGVFRFDLETGQEVYRVLSEEEGGFTGPRSGLTVSSDGRFFLTGHYKDPVLRLHDVKSGKEVRAFEGHTSGIRAVALARDGKTAASGGDDQTVRIWDLETGQERKRIDTGAPVYCVAFAPDARWVVSGHYSGMENPEKSHGFELHLWDTRTGGKVRTFKRQTVPVHNDVTLADLVFLPDGKSFVSVGFEDTVRQWDVDSGRQIRQFEHPLCVPSLALTPDGGRLLTACDDGSLRLWDLHEGHLLYCSAAHKSEATQKIAIARGVSISPDGLRALGSYEDGGIRLWALPGPASAAGKRKAVLPPGEIARWKAHDRQTLVAMHPAGKVLASGGEDGLIKLWNVADGKELRFWHGHTGVVLDLLFSPDGRKFASCSMDRTVKWWDAETAALLGSIEMGPAEPWSLTFAADSELLFVGVQYDRDGKGSVRRVDLKTQNDKVMAAFDAPVSTLGANKQRTLAIATWGDFKVRLWDMVTAKEEVQLQIPSANANSLEFDPKGEMLAVGGKDPAIGIWDLSGKAKLTMVGLKRPVMRVAFSPDGKLLVSGGGEWRSPDGTGELKVWDPATGKELATLGNNLSCVARVVIAADGKTCFTGHFDGTIHKWRLPKVPGN